MMDYLTLLAHRAKFKQRSEPKYWEAYQCGLLIGVNNSIKLLRHQFTGVKGVVFKCVR